jgi:hypothetical protein
VGGGVWGGGARVARPHPDHGVITPLPGGRA